MKPIDIEAAADLLIRAAREYGVESTIEITRGGSIDASGQSVGAGVASSGDKLDSSITGTPATFDLGGTTASGESIGQTFSGFAWSPPDSSVELGLMAAGVLVLLGAGWGVYRGRLGLALTMGAIGAGLIGTALYPPLALLAVLGAVVGLILFYRGDLRYDALKRGSEKIVMAVETKAPSLKSDIKHTTTQREKKAIGKVLKSAGVA